MKKSLLEKNIFTYKLELFSLFLPVGFFCLIFYEFYFRQNVLNNFTGFQVSILANIIFLNITHNAFTVMLLTSTLPLKVWIEHHGGPRKFWGGQFVLLLILTLFFTGLLYFGYQSKVAFITLGLIGFNFAAHHALSQTFGLSLIYTKDVIRNKHFFKAEKLERQLFTIFLFSNLILGNFFFVGLYRFFSISPDVLHELVKYSALFILLIGLALVVHPYYFFKKEYMAKSLFNIRYLLWPFTFVSSVAPFSTLVIHGVEYGLVTNKMLRNDSFRRPVLAVVVVILVVLFAIVRIDSMANIKGHQPISMWLITATGFSTAFSFLHYYLDRKLFKMRHKINRETVGSLLFNEPKHEEAIDV